MDIYLGEKMRKTFLSIMAAVLTAITLITIIPFTTGKVEAATTYKERNGSTPFEGSYFGNPVEYDIKFRYYYPENYNGSDADVVFLFHGQSKIDSIDKIEKADNEITEDYLSRWVNNYGVRPFVLIIPKIEEICNDGKENSMNEWDYRHFVEEGPLEQLISNVKRGDFVKAGANSNIYITGYSMGGSCSLYAATQLGAKYNFKGVGAFSPSFHFMSDYCESSFYYRGWGTVAYPNIDFWYFGYNSHESNVFKDNACRYYNDFCESFSDGRAKLNEFNYVDPTCFNDHHNWRLFRRELFTFLYCISHDYKSPDENTINSANDLNALIWVKSEESNDVWLNSDVEEWASQQGNETIADIQEAKSKQPVPKYYTVHYYVDGTEVCSALVQENCPIPKYPCGLSGEYIWYYGKDTKARQVDYTKGVTKDYNVNGTKIK